jgi:hypothetical protein
MATSIYPDGNYDFSKPPWYQNATDRVQYERTFQQGTREEMLEAQALINAQATTQSWEIHAQFDAPEQPRFGATSQQPTLDDIFMGNLSQSDNLNNHAPTDFSGSNAGQEATSIPSIPYWA